MILGKLRIWIDRLRDAQVDRELFTLVKEQNNGAKLSVFADWAAGQDPQVVQHALERLQGETQQLPSLSSKKIVVFPQNR